MITKLDYFIPWAKPELWGKEVEYVTDAIKSTWISGGDYLDRLELEFSEILKTKHVLAVSNGTAALHLAYLGANLQPGDEIIIPGFAFLGAANVAIQMGIKPVFAEVHLDTWCLDPVRLNEYITPKTKAIVPVHTYGNVCDMDKINSVAESKGLLVLEDCAESLFSKYNNNYSGTFGKINTFSFQATKTITTGEGGLVVTNSYAIADTMKLYRSHGMRRKDRHYWHEVAGHNFRLTNIQAAMGVAQLEHRELICEERERVYKEYCKLLSEVEGLKMQIFHEEVEPTVWVIAVIIEKKIFGKSRDQIMAALKESKIETRPGFYSPGFMDIYECAHLPICESLSENVLSLPSFPSLSNEEIEYICEQLIGLKE